MKKIITKTIKEVLKTFFTLFLGIFVLLGSVYIYAQTKNNGDILLASDWNSLISSINGIKDKQDTIINGIIEKQKIIDAGCEDTITLGTQVWCAQNSKLKHDFLFSSGNYFYKGINKAKACPTGFRVPNIADWNTARSNSGSNEDTLATNLGLSRYAGLGVNDYYIQWQGNYGAYWNNENGSMFLLKGNNTNYPWDHNVNSAMVRCIKN